MNSPSVSFNQLGLRAELEENLASLGYTSMTEIQAMCLPDILEGRDVVAQAQTGSGKTAAFGLGILSQIIVADYYIQSLVLCPTRELADQVSIELRKLGRRMENLKVLTLCGGTPVAPQVASLEHGAHIIVGTPGRILDLLGRRILDLNNIHTMILDEADRMLDMGFAEDIEDIIRRTPKNKQTLLFSATYPDNIKKMSGNIQKNPLFIKTKVANTNKNIEQFFFETKKDNWYEGLHGLLSKYQPQSSIIFCTTKVQCDEVAEYLNDHSVSALAIHSDLDQYQRNEVLVQFANGSVCALVATDVAARGLDIKNLHAVINFEISKDPEIHIHRIGRTGRAGETGLALTLYNRSEVFRVKAIEALTGDTYQRDLQPPPSKSKKIGIMPTMTTVKINGGKKNKLRPGDILGALTNEANLSKEQIGKIDIFEFHAYVAIDSSVAAKTMAVMENAKIKNRNFRMRTI